MAKSGLGVPVIPEAASLLLRGGYPSPDPKSLAEMRYFQETIIQLYASLEGRAAIKHPDARFLVLDRAPLNGAGVWPRGPASFLREFRIDLRKELQKYDRVLFFHLPPARYFGGVGSERFTDYEQSEAMGKKLHRLWSQHTHFIEIPFFPSFPDKVRHVLDVVGEIVGTGK